jgi:hypothetical protein
MSDMVGLYRELDDLIIYAYFFFLEEERNLSCVYIAKLLVVPQPLVEIWCLQTNASCFVVCKCLEYHELTL